MEKAILTNHLQGFDASALGRLGLRRLTTAAELLQLQQQVRQVRVDDSLLDYITEIVGRTREHRAIYFGASPRASIALLLGAQALAAVEGRAFVIPDDVKALAPAVLRHRVGLQPDAEIEGVTPTTAWRRSCARCGCRPRPPPDRRGKRPYQMSFIPTARLCLLALLPLGLGVATVDAADAAGADAGRRRVAGAGGGPGRLPGPARPDHRRTGAAPGAVRGAAQPGAAAAALAGDAGRCGSR